MKWFFWLTGYLWLGVAFFKSNIPPYLTKILLQNNQQHQKSINSLPTHFQYRKNGSKTAFLSRFWAFSIASKTAFRGYNSFCPCQIKENPGQTRGARRGSRIRFRQYCIIHVCGLRSKIFRQVVQINWGKAVALPRFFGQADGIRKGKPCALNCAVLP